MAMRPRREATMSPVRLPRTTAARPRTGSTATAGPVQPEWQMAASEKAVSSVM